MELANALALPYTVKNKAAINSLVKRKISRLNKVAVLKKAASCSAVRLPLKLKNFYIKNGYSDLLRNLKVEVYSDIKDCFKLWDEFSPKEGLFDLWNFRLAFYKAYKPKLHFMLFKSGEEKIGLLPLWFEDWDKKYYWFGGWWQEENNFFAKKSIFIPLMLAVCPKPVLLNTISFPIYQRLGPAKDFVSFLPDDPKYVLDLRGMNHVDDYLKRLKKSRRKSLKKNRIRIEKQNPEVIINNFSDLKHLFRLSSERLAEKGQKCDWDEFPEDKKVFEHVIKLAGKGYDIKMISIKINNIIAGVDLIAIVNGCYYAMICGYNVKQFSGIGNYFNLLEIEDALRMGLKKIDFLENNYQWKDRWFQAVPLLKYEIK